MERLAHTTQRIDFNEEPGEVGDVIDFLDLDIDSYIHQGRGFPFEPLAVCDPSSPNRAQSHDGHTNHTSPHYTLPTEESQDGTEFRPDVSTYLAFSTAAQLENGALDSSITRLTELCPDNGSSFLAAQYTTNLGMDHPPLVEPHLRKRNAESVEKFNNEQFNKNYHGNTVQDTTSWALTVTSSASSASDSTPPEGSSQFSCKRPRCKWNKPFKTRGDFNRHQLLHGPRKFKCPMDFCARSRKGFYRKDKLISHLEKGHYTSKQQAKMLACEQELAMEENLVGFGS